jgi:hypothetical protein
MDNVQKHNICNYPKCLNDFCPHIGGMASMGGVFNANLVSKGFYKRLQTSRSFLKFFCQVFLDVLMMALILFASNITHLLVTFWQYRRNIT